MVADSPDCLPITKIVDTVHFVEKDDAFLLQIADVCALMIRYAYEGKSSAKEFFNLLLGENVVKTIEEHHKEIVGFHVLPHKLQNDG